MGTRLWSRWDTVTLLAYEAVAVPIALFVRGNWLLPAFIVAFVALMLVVRRGERGTRLRASMPRGTGSAPWVISLAACTAVMVAVSLALRALGADDSTGWLIVAVGLVNPTITVTDRWWTARRSAPA